MDIFHKKERQQLVQIVVALSILLVIMAIVLGYFVWHDSSKVCLKSECPESSCQGLLTDTDGDLISDEVEIKIFKTDPKNADTDGDGYFDFQELASGHDPLVPAAVK
jgi:hypothetical protein